MAFPAAAQLNNASLKGTYAFRYLGETATPCDCPVSFIGTVTFDGNGGFTVSAQGVAVTVSGGSSQTATSATSGTYTVFSSGMYYMDNPFAAAGTNTVLYGGIGQGAVVASSTESNNLDMFVAIPQATSASNATLTGNYQVGSLEFAGGTLNGSRNTIFTMTADGKGGLGNVSISGTSIPLNGAATTQTSTGATYSATANGSGTMTFPAPSGVSTANVLLSGAKTLYVSQDGSIFIAGMPNGYDMIIGIKAMPSGAPNPPLNGEFFVTEFDNDTLTGDQSGISAYWGATNELGDKNADELIHWRVNNDLYGSFDQTFSGSYTFNSSGVSASPGITRAAGGNGNYYIEAGNGGDYYLGLGVKLTSFTGTGAFLFPNGVVNAATNTPFTAQLSPGEVITLYGTGLAPAGTNLVASAPFPNSLGGIGVTINGTPAPVYLVSPTQINAVVPYTIDPSTTSVVQVAVTNSNTNSTSNGVTEYFGSTSPGVFTVPPGGLGSGAILHSNFSLVSTSSPAAVGETVQIFLTGLGAVSPAVNAGAPAPSNPLSTVPANGVQVYIDGLPATISYAGLAPGLGGLYQLNVQIPSGVTSPSSGVVLEVDGSDSITFQATIPIK